VLVHCDVHSLVVLIHELSVLGAVVHWVIRDQGLLVLVA
jgi:hypothetical protein